MCHLHTECHVHTGGPLPGRVLTAVTRDSHGSDRGRLVGGAAHRLKVKPVLAVKIAGKRSQKHRLGVGGGLFSEKEPDGAAA